MSTPRVGLCFGGRSVEHEVSVRSARSVAAATRGADIDWVPLGVTPAGRWLSPAASARVLEGSEPRVPADGGGDAASVAFVPGEPALVVLEDGRARRVELDALFPLIHGQGGEDGRLQGAADLAGIPCVGAGVLGSAAAMDKAVTKQILEHRGIRGVEWRLATAAGWTEDARGLASVLTRELGFPMFVKPANGGSSVGIARVTEAAALPAALDAAFRLDARVVVERGIDAREIECAVLGNHHPEASVLGEIEPGAEFYDYDAKYLDDTSRLLVPAPLSPETTARIRQAALDAFRALDLSGFARVDFFVERGSGAVYLNEINTLPGFTSISMFPMLWEASGLPCSRLVRRLIDLALERAAEVRSRRTRLEESGA